MKRKVNDIMNVILLLEFIAGLFCMAVGVKVCVDRKMYFVAVTNATVDVLFVLLLLGWAGRKGWFDSMPE